jgi:adenine-specific DNA-methyltransferase
MQNLDGKSMNIIEQNIEKLKEIFPEVFSEGKIDFSKLEEELGAFKDDVNERYNFTWNGKSEAKKIALTPSTGTLRPCKTESKDWDTTQNLYIEGDNLEVLKLLQKSYHKKVKMIYIDPPYNTGKDFVYKDNFRDNIKNYLEITGQVDSDGNKLSTNSETSGRYHSDWLNMMYPRLKLARNLLKDDGVIFISIDDNEVINLRKICDEIFGEDNFVSQIMVIVKTEGRQYGNFAKTHEYILVYAKSIESLNLNKIKSLKGEFKYFDNQGGFNTIGLRNRAVRIFNSTNRPNLRYPFYVDANQMDENGFFQVSVEKNDDWIEVLPSIVDGLESVWRWGKETAGKKINDLVALKGNDNEIRIFKKDRELTTLPKTVWFEKEFNSIVGTREIATLFGESYFDFPKPVKLLQQLLCIGSNENDLILDFFSGSATTAHAVMKLNSEDDGNRKFICVQLPETTDEKSEAFKAGYKNICEIGKERIRRAGEKVKTESGKDDLDIGFKVLKLDSSNIKSWDSDFENLTQNLFDSVENIKSDRNEEDLVYEILLKYGLDLTLPIEELNINGKKIFSIGFGSLVCCLDNDIDTNIVEKIAELKKQFETDFGLENMRVVFKDSSFKDSVVKTNALQILKQNGINEVVSV